MTREEVRVLIQSLEQVFDVVRLVDGTITEQYVLDENGELQQEKYKCYSVWGREERCKNCISAKVLSKKEKMTKFEFEDQSVYYVMAQYLEIEGKPFVLEMIHKNSDETLFSAYGKNKFVETVLSYNKKIYADPLTGAYNRQYFEEQIMGFSHINAVAMLDVDNFKKINDTWGHQVGDEALKMTAQTVISCIRSRDAMIRYGGDEFLIVFPEMPVHVFENKLNLIREKCRAIVFEKYPELEVTVSIGGYFGQGEMMEKIREADRMLYGAKEERDTVKIKFE